MCFELTLQSIILGSCDANDAVQITMVQPDQEKPKTLTGFHPAFTYPIFGEEEQIFGYKGLIVRLRFAAHNLRPHVHVSYDEKFSAVEDTAPVDITKALKDFLPEGMRFYFKAAVNILVDCLTRVLIQRPFLRYPSSRAPSRRKMRKTLCHQESWFIATPFAGGTTRSGRHLLRIPECSCC